MDFRITRHSGFAAPDDALELLWQRLDADRGRMRLVKRGTEIRAILREDSPVSMEHDEREELGRLAILEAVRKACEDDPQLELDWFAVGAVR